MRLAAFDLGSNSFHVLVADVDADGWFVAHARDREMLRLGAAVATRGRISASDRARAGQVVTRFRAIAEEAEATDVVAVATSALREAANATVVLDELSARAGTEIRVLDGDEEGRLAYAGMRAGVALPSSPVLGLDLGGGSLELVSARGGDVVRVDSLAVGTARLAGEFARHDPLTKSERRAIRDAVHARVGAAARVVDEHRPGDVVAAGGAIRALARFIAVERWGDAPTSVNQLRVSADEIAAARDVLVPLRQRERTALPGVKSRRSDLIHVAATIVSATLDALGITSVVVSEWGLREGLLLDAAGCGDVDGAARRHEAVRRFVLQQRPDADVAALERAADRAAATAARPYEREILRYAAVLRALGRKEGRALIEGAGLPGFSPEEHALLAQLVRAQRSGELDPSDATYRRLEDPTRAAWLAGAFAGRREAAALAV